MIMPVVSRQKMAMNESICATCCYRYVVSPTNYSWEVLYGGLVGQPQNSNPNMLVWREGIPKAWAELPYDVDFSVREGMQAKPSYSVVDSKWYVLYFANDVPFTKMPLEQFMSGPDALAAVVNEGCRHIDESCLYIDVIPAPSLHTGATDAHATGGLDYAADHVALQFNS